MHKKKVTKLSMRDIYYRRKSLVRWGGGTWVSFRWVYVLVASQILSTNTNLNPNHTPS